VTAKLKTAVVGATGYSGFELTRILLRHPRVDFPELLSRSAEGNANLADLFGLNRFVQILHDYAADHWLGVTRTADFKAEIEAAAIADGVAFDAATYWDDWRVD